MTRIERTVFISYRRKDISWALAVYQYLTSQKYDVFFDYTSLSGGDFEQVIVSNIKARAHFVSILTPTALDRCSEPGDWLRREIETAVDEKRNIIPLFFDGFNFSLPSVAQKLTGKLSAINRYNGLDVPAGYFMEAMERLSSRYLNVPLNAVIHPVSTEVRKVVKDEQIAANMALIQKSEDIKELVKPIEEVLEERRQEQRSLPARTVDKDVIARPSLRLYGIGVAILVVAALGIFGINSLIQNSRRDETRNPTLAPEATVALTSTSVPTEALATPTVTLIPATPVPTLGIGSVMSSAKDGMTLVYVPAGEFIMGTDNGERADERPAHKVYLDAFWIDQTEVTNKMYSTCVLKNGCKEPTDKTSAKNFNYFGNIAFDNFPIIHVDWSMAEAYCTWADRRLPSEAEWEKAARGDDGRMFPWGNDPPSHTLLNYDGDKQAGDTSSVKSYEAGKSIYGAYDMAGNVWEWVNDWYSESYYLTLEPSNPLGPASGDSHVERGGSFYEDGSYMYSARRDFAGLGFVSFNLGFRCAMSASK